MKRDIFNAIDAQDAYEILKIMAKKDEDMAKIIEQVALDYLNEVDPEDVAADVYSVLDNIPVEDVWHFSADTRRGYVDSTQATWEIFEEAMEPFLAQLKKYQDLPLSKEAKSHCKGILEGLHKFGKESDSEYREWAEGCPGNYGAYVLKKWKEGVDDAKEITEMEQFFEERFSEWHI